MSKVTINSQHIKLYLRLKMQEYGLDRSLAALMGNAKSDLDNWKSIKHDIDRFESERKKTEDPSREAIIDIYQELKSVKEMMTPDKVNKLDLDDFKKKLQSLWKRIQEFKNSCVEIDDLANEQKSLSAEIDELSRKIRKHENFNSTNNDNFYTRIVNVKAALQKQQESAQECDYSEVENFFALISKSGHSGGWSERDHLLYVKLRERYKTNEALVAGIRAKCPDLSEEEILKHDSWYAAYLDLRQKQKVAVQQWRERKEAERQRKKAPAKENEKPRISSAPVDAKTIAERNEAAAEKRKEMLDKWKEQKAMQKFMREEEERLRIQQARSRRRTIRTTVKIKKLVGDYRENKSKCDGDRPVVAVTKSRRASFRSSLFLQLYRARDQQYLEKRKKVLAKINAPKQKPDLQVQRDFSKCQESTLLRETRAWQEKLKFEPNDKPPAWTVFYIKDVPRLGKNNQTSDSSLNRHL